MSAPVLPFTGGTVQRGSNGDRLSRLEADVDDLNRQFAKVQKLARLLELREEILARLDSLPPASADEIEELINDLLLRVVHDDWEGA
jgi:hypothetical protein